MGAVYLAWDTILHRLVALKLMFSQTATDGARFLREAKAQAAVDHPNVLAIYDFDQDNGQYYIAMPVLEGETLAARLARDKVLTPFEVMWIACGIAAGVAAVHARGFTHRDLKPSNIALCGDRAAPLPPRPAPEAVRVFDLGLAKSQSPGEGDDLTRANAVLGTPAYMAPEQAVGKPVPASDMFALGVVMLEAAAGKKVFVGKTSFDCQLAVRETHPIPPHVYIPNFPPRLSALMMRLLEKDPASRPTAAEVVAELLAMLAAEEHAAQPTPTPAPAPPSPVAAPAPACAKRFRIGRLALPLVALALVAAGVVVIVRDKDGNVLYTITLPDGANIEIAQKPPAGAPPKPLPLADRDRKAAEYVLSVDGTVRVNGADSGIKTATELPREPFALTGVDLNGIAKVRDADLAVIAACAGLIDLRLYGTSVTDEGLVHLRNHRLTILDLGKTKVSDAGLAHLKGSAKSLTSLHLFGTTVTDDGLSNFAGCDRLLCLALGQTRVNDACVARFAGAAGIESLYLDGTDVTDTTLVALKGRARLRSLTVQNSKASAAGVAALAKALPLCQIVWDGGTIEPKVFAAPPTKPGVACTIDVKQQVDWRRSRRTARRSSCAPASGRPCMRPPPAARCAPSTAGRRLTRTAAGRS